MTTRIDDGFATLIEFSEAPTIKFYEKTVTPPGVQGGGANDVTTMRNEEWRTMSPKHLKTLSESGATVSYDPAVYDDVVAMVQVNQLITITFPDGSSVAFWGWLDEFVPGPCQEGQQPTAEIKILPSNHDADLVETGPDYADA